MKFQTKYENHQIQEEQFDDEQITIPNMAKTVSQIVNELNNGIDPQIGSPRSGPLSKDYDYFELHDNAAQYQKIIDDNTPVDPTPVDPTPVDPI